MKGYHRTAKPPDMRCPDCSSYDTWRMKSLYTPVDPLGREVTEELWECRKCKTKWTFEQKLEIMK